MACRVVEPSDAIFEDPTHAKIVVGDGADRWDYVSAISATDSCCLLATISARDLTPQYAFTTRQPVQVAGLA